MTDVKIESDYITRHIRNTKGLTPTAGCEDDDDDDDDEENSQNGDFKYLHDVCVWQADSMASYEDNSDSFVSGSYYPVGVDVAKNDVTIVVAFDIPKELLGVPLRIHGDNDVSESVMEQSATKPHLFDVAEQYEIAITVRPPWARADIPWGVAGNIAWRFCLEETGQVIGLNFSRLELYAINRKVTPLFKGTGNAVPVTLLRRFVLPQRTQALDFSWEKHCCSLAFHSFGFRYDINDGVAHYYDKGASAVYFRLRTYLSDISNGPGLVNCYDQAWIMFVCLQLSAATDSVELMKMKPFGFIKTTVLIGRGACNNPFYPEDRPQPICESNSKTRQHFSLHWFVRVGGDKGRIVDACAGPHLGNESLDDFIEASIDTSNTTRLIGGRKDAGPFLGPFNVELR